MLQLSNSASGNMKEGKRYFCGMHHLYGYKTAVSVRTNELACSVSNHVPGSISDIIILCSPIKDYIIRI